MPLLEIRDVNVHFGGHHAVREVNMNIDSGHVTGLIGPNGAGKTTTFNVVTGLQECTTGTINLEGKDISSLGTHERARAGLAKTFQRLEVFGSLTAYENILVAAEIRAQYSKDKSDPRPQVQAIVERVGIQDVANERVDSLPTGSARLVELGRALVTRPKVLFLDEAASGLSEPETEDFAVLLRELSAEGLAIVMVEHDVPLVMDVCEYIYVLDLGAILAEGVPDEIKNNQLVIDAYLGAG